LVNFKRIFFATDVHGSEICFRKFLASADFYKADILILGGDITGKMLVPITETSDGKYVSNYLDVERHFNSKEGLLAFEETVRNSGFYPYRTSQEELNALKEDSSKLDRLFSGLMMERLGGWISLAEETLKGKSKRCFITGGNDDPFEVSEVIRKSDLVVNPEEQVVAIDDSHEMISLGYSNPTPWKLPRDIPEEKLTEMIGSMASKLKTVGSSVFNLHVPPKDSMLDQCQMLDGSSSPPKPVTKNGHPVIYGGGSKAVIDAIQKYQPLLGLHGHIHESRAAQKFGRTLCLNPGSEYSEGILRGVIVSYDKDKIVSYQFT
jgi:Icc-related predicted phosphoesterase